MAHWGHVAQWGRGGQDPHNAVVRIIRRPCGSAVGNPADCSADLFFYERVAPGVLRYEYIDAYCIPERCAALG